MLGGLLLAAAVPKAYGGYAIIFAGTYVAIHLGRGLFLMHVLHGHPAFRRSARVAAWFAITGVAWVAGALEPAAQIPLWTVAIVLDATIGLVGYPIPGLGRSTQDELKVAGGHLTARFAQLVIVAVGDLILVSGLSFRDAGFHLPSIAAFVLAFVNALLITQIYYLPIGRGLAPTGEQARTQGRQALTIAYLHLFLLAAILAAAAGHELVIAHAGDRGRDSVRVTLVAATALFLAWRAVLVGLIRRGFPWWLLVGVLAVIAIEPALAHLPLVAASAAVDLVLLVVALADQARSRRERALIRASAG
jgi:low temperature requirement protein LtrA